MRTLSIFDAGGKNSTKNDKHNSWDLQKYKVKI